MALFDVIQFFSEWQIKGATDFVDFVYIAQIRCFTEDTNLKKKIRQS